MAEVSVPAVTAVNPESPAAVIAGPSPPATKRRRLNFACNACRRKKVRCDEQHPCCRNCRAAGIPCITTDTRRPGVTIRRHEAGNHQSLSPPAVTSPFVVSAHASESLISVHRNSISEGRSGLSAASDTRSHRVSSVGGESGRRRRQDAEEGRRGRDEGVGGQQGEVHLNPDSHAEIRPDGTRRFAGRLPILTQNSGRTSLELLTDWLDLAFYRLGLHSQFAPAMLLSSIPLSTPSAAAGSSLETAAISTDVPALPSLQECRKLVDVYFRDVDSIFGLLDRHKITQDLEVACLFGGPHRLLRERGLPPLLQLYLVLGLGAISAPELDFSADFSHRIINFCQTLLGHIMGWNTLEAVQIVFLLSLSLRCLDKTSSSWSSIGLCVSMAVSLGINRRTVSLPNQSTRGTRNGNSGEEFEKRRTWWCVYAWEKLHAFELGRASCIIDSDCSQQELDDHDAGGLSSASSEHRAADSRPESDLPVLVTLAKTLSSVSRKCIQMRNKEDRAITESAMTEKTNTTVSSCLEIMEWAEKLDGKYRLQTDLLTGSRATPSAIFLGLSFNNALIMLMRNTILVNPVILQRFIDRLSGSKSWAPLLKRSNGVAVNAARRIVRLLVEVTEMDLHPVLPSLVTPLQAAYILMVQVINDPKSRTISSDLALIQQAHEFALQHYARSYRDGRLNVLLDSLNNFMMRQVTVAHGPNMASKALWLGAPSALGTQIHNTDFQSPATLLGTSINRGSNNSEYTSAVEVNPSLAPISTDSITALSSPGSGGIRGAHIDSGTSTTTGPIPERPFEAAVPGMDESGTDLAGFDVPWWPVLVDDIGWDWADLAQVI